MWCIVKYRNANGTAYTQYRRTSKIEGILSEHAWITEAREALRTAQNNYGAKVALVLAETVKDVKPLHGSTAQAAKRKHAKLTDRVVVASKQGESLQVAI